MDLTIALVTDLHFGPEARFGGKLRKLTAHAPDLARAFVDRMNRDVAPDLVVNLGDDIEDEAREPDVARYEACQTILRETRSELVNVAGNHDTIHMGREDLLRIWREGGPRVIVPRENTLYWSFDRGGHHFVVLHTLEKKDVEVRIPHTQLSWLVADLAATKLPVIVLMHHSASEQDLSDSSWFRGLEHLALLKERAELRRIFEESGKVRVVFNGHVHRNHVDLIRGIPYVTIQSLIENLDDDAPGRPAAAFAVARIDDTRITVRVGGNDPAAYQFEGGR